MSERERRRRKRLKRQHASVRAQCWARDCADELDAAPLELTESAPEPEPPLPGNDPSAMSRVERAHAKRKKRAARGGGFSPAEQLSPAAQDLYWDRRWNPEDYQEPEPEVETP